MFFVEHGGAPDVWVRGKKLKSSPTPILMYAINVGGCWSCPEVAHGQGTTFDGLKRLPPSEVCFFNCTNEVLMNTIYSFHPGGGLVAMCDGSVKMLNEGIGITPFCNMITYNGRTPVADTF
jgi:prepilin-type processing-associated H-X9-DG protein